MQKWYPNMARVSIPFPATTNWQEENSFLQLSKELYRGEKQPNRLDSDLPE